jgi:PEGA domain-containing protein
VRGAWLASLLACALGGGGCAHHETAGKAPPSESDETEEKAVTAPPSSTTPTASGATAAPAGQATVGAPAKPQPVKIRIVVRSSPPKATVFWGKKKLGDTPVTLERPRDSGPIDLVVRNEGYFPVHTRAYTFKNDGVMVRMTKLDDRMTLFGAKREVTESPDGGVPPQAPTPVAPPQ